MRRLRRQCACVSRMLVCLVLATGVAAAEKTIELETVLSSSRDHFPRVQSAVAGVLEKRGRLTEAMGAFDLALEQESVVWADGFYDGVSTDTKVTRRFGSANARIFGGYRVSNDDFPIYQQELVTNDGGEFNLGLVFSMWRDRATDSGRMAVENARLGVREAQIE